MWIVKGILLGALLFVVGSVIYVIAMIEMGTARATGTTALRYSNFLLLSWSIHNPLYWLAFVATLILGCVVVKRLARKGAL
jgi:hypothetical protein